MAGVNMPSVEGLVTVEDLKNAVAKMTKELTWLLNNLDTRNMNYIDGDVVVDGTITATKIQVDELSAISANLGHIVAGLIESVEIYGSYIATRNGDFPRAEMSSDNNLFGAYIDANHYIQILSDDSGVPSLIFVHGGQVKSRLSTLLGTLLLDAIGGMEINVTGGQLTLPKFTSIVSSDGYNLGVELDGKAVAGISTNPSGGHNHGIPDGTVLQKADGGTVTFFAAPTHTHQQTN